MFAILTFIITTVYFFQSWSIEYGDPVYSVIVLLACIPAALADYQVLKEIRLATVTVNGYSYQ